MSDGIVKELEDPAGSAVCVGKSVEAQAVPPSQAMRSPPIHRVSVKPWLIFAAAIVLAVFVHELGHCAVAWSYGCPAIPTPAKEYLLGPLPAGAQDAVSLGGVAGSIVCLIGATYWFLRQPGTMRSALVAGAMTLPGFYVLRFFLAGRGHDATEFQEAQAALGLSYSGHALDWLFLALFALAATGWVWRVRPLMSRRFVLRLVAGAVVGLVVLIVLQVGNNALFDPLLQR